MVKKSIIFMISILAVTSNFHAVYGEVFFPSTNVRLNGPSTYCIITPTISISDNKIREWVKLTEDAVLDWEKNLKDAEFANDSVWDMEVVESTQQDNDKCDVKIEFKDKPSLSDTVGGYFSWPPGKVVIYYLQPKLCEGLVPCYDDKTLKSNNMIYAIAIHEIGHSLGLDHYVSDDNDINEKWKTGDESPPSAMIPTIPRMAGLLKITDIDVKKVREIYGPEGFFAFSDSKIPKPQPEPESTPEPLIPVDPFTSMNVSEKIIEVDTYDRQIITLSGRISEEEFYRGLPVIITVHRPDDSVEVLKIKTTGDGYFETLLIFDKESLRGLYRISASYIGHVDKDMDVTFQVVEKQPDLSTKKPTLDRENQNNSNPQIAKSSRNIEIPNWVKNNAEWWATEQISDHAFVSSIQYLMEQKIIFIPDLPKSAQNAEKMPVWVKNIAGFWAKDSINDEEFVKSIQYMVGNGIIVIP